MAVAGEREGSAMSDNAAIIERLTQERDQARETARRLNERAQRAEGIIAAAGLVEGRPQGKHGRSLGRALANYSAHLFKRERDELADTLESLLEELESMARQHCHTRKVGLDYKGQVAGTLVTDSGALSANALTLRTLAKQDRFRIVNEYGRMVVGYWPENDPNAKGQP